ncbi:VWFA and cache domain-containing protein 1-like [Saccoglossus kowalevskii]|uniref:VWFA and cache domain-containing protein 1-like n=1 Tax=Saccoglossus kowalevskii TaxID=10224 RepID=A0ABM0N023_SACKO|nr:PREDICTED: VWFA and cache domain-containing protein 1-like [Saccoglossus kowalevskii]
MAAARLILFVCALVICRTETTDSNNEDSVSRREHPGRRVNRLKTGQNGMINFNNPELLEELVSNGYQNGDNLPLSLLDLYEQEQPENPKTIMRDASILAGKLRDLADREMGYRAMQAIYDSLLYVDRAPNEEQQIQQLVRRIRAKFSQYLRILSSSKASVEDLYKKHRNSAMTSRNDCCQLPIDATKYDGVFQSNISRTQVCDRISTVTPSGVFNPGKNLTQVLANNLRSYPSLKWQYFSSEEGIKTIFPATLFNSAHCSMSCSKDIDPRSSALYASTVRPQKKHVVVVIDRGSMVSDDLLKIAKKAAEIAVETLSEKDRVGVLSIASTIHTCKDDSCYLEQLAPSTVETKKQLNKFIQGIKSDDGATNHTQAILRAFKLIKNSVKFHSQGGINSDALIILYISSGHTAGSDAVKTVMNTIVEQNTLLNNKVIIMTYALVEDGKTGLDELAFLRDVAEQNSDKYEVIPTLLDTQPRKKGIMTVLNIISNLPSTVGRFYSILPNNMSSEPIYTLPYMDQIGKGLVMTITQACYYNNRLLGIVGIDLNMGDMLEDITYFEEGELSYAFMVDDQGYTLMHPSLPRPTFMKSQPMHADISHFENVDGFTEIRQSLASSGDYKLYSNTMMLSAGSFTAPFEHLSQEETKRMVQHYMAYLNDNTRLIANPGLKPAIKNDVAATSGIDKHWKNQVETSDVRDFIVRRYVATTNGVFRLYIRAMENPGQVTLSAPYLDVGGAGYIVTLSHSVYEGKSDQRHTSADRVVATMGIDFTIKYFYKLLMEIFPICVEQYIRCFIFDDKGYLIAHPGLIEPAGTGPSEQTHITHKEPLVANDILNHPGFVRKKLCNGYNDRTVQRYFHFNASFHGILTNLKHGEHCSKYEITQIPGTNSFMGIVNQTCEDFTAFCPCSMVDRLCLNCYRMEQTECECPCECTLEMDQCNGSLKHHEDRNPSCQLAVEPTKFPEVDLEATIDLPQCFDPKCHERKTKSDCFGVLDCEWCEIEADGTSSVTTPYCASQRVCFGGVIGASTPYADQIILSDEAMPALIQSAPVGPVAGGIMGCILVLGLIMYVYRQHVQRLRRAEFSHTPETSVRMSQLDNERDHDEDPPDEQRTVGHTNIIIATIEHPPHYEHRRQSARMWRGGGAESDHGYSTMTPHEDSEYIEPEPLSVEKNLIGPQPTSTPQTVLPSTSGATCHQLQAQVQVHMVDMSC